MKSYINKIFSVLCVALALSMSSCVGDLDLLPNDPNTLTADKFKENPKEYINEVMAKCYSGLSVSGQGGASGSADISGIDGNTGQYTRALFMLNEFTTDESKWIWKDAGVVDLVTNTWGTDNVNIFGTYSRLYAHIAVCNEFLRLVDEGNMSTLGIPVDDDLRATINEYKLETRALRAMSYYNAIDLFGNASFIDETSPSGTNPVQKTRLELYNWLKAELEDVVAAMPTTTAKYGRINRDGAEALLCRLYLNAKVYTNNAEDGYAKCSEHCANIIARHQGGGFNGSGLAEHYMYLFCGDNDAYAPGGSKPAENETLWNIPYDSEYIQTFGGSLFLTAGAYTNVDKDGAYMNMVDYGLNAQWGCMHATSQFSDKFTSDDIRCSMWCKEANGFSKENTGFSTFTDGYAVVKFTNLLQGTNGSWSVQNGGKFDPSGTIAARADNFPDTDIPLLRLADVYLMYAESYIMANAGSQDKALEYVNYVRERAGVAKWTASDLTADNILDERCRELYWENVRRPDLIRFGKFTGNTYVWSWKNNVLEGGSIPSHFNLFPIPTNVIAAQPEFKQNTGY